MRAAAGLLLLALLLGGCSGEPTGGSDQAASPGDRAPAVAPSPPASAGTPGEALALRLVNGFQRAGLPAASPRVQTESCAGFGCTGLVDTDSVSVYVFASQAEAARFSDGLSTHRNGVIVLAYPRGTAGRQRAAYENFLQRNCAAPCAPPGDPDPAPTRVAGG